MNRKLKYKMNDYKKRLRAEKQEFTTATLSAKGHRDGVAYAKNAEYGDLVLIRKYDENLHWEDSADADSLACAVGEVERPDQDTREWIKDSLSESWADETTYIAGFIRGVREVLAEVDNSTAD